MEIYDIKTREIGYIPCSDFLLEDSGNQGNLEFLVGENSEAIPNLKSVITDFYKALKENKINVSNIKLTIKYREVSNSL